MLVKKSLEPAGYEIMEAENGKDALAKCSPEVSLFLVDINMPEMNGFEFVEELKKQAAYKDKPIVFLTTESSAEKKDMGKNLGVKGWIVKPFEPSALLKIADMLTG
ncbi:MAG: response regulator [Spirochaetales bacterium]|nr:response regulator [Spirochaetales bacterium]